MAMRTVTLTAEIIYDADTVNEKWINARFRQLVQDAVFGAAADPLLSWENTALDICFNDPAQEPVEERPKIWGDRYRLADANLENHALPGGGTLILDGYWFADGQDILKCRAVQRDNAAPGESYSFEIVFAGESSKISSIRCYDRRGRLTGTPAWLRDASALAAIKKSA